MKRFVIALVLVATATVVSADHVGFVSYLEGYPELTRDGVVLYETLDYGYLVENFDAVATDDESYVELNIDMSGVDATIKIAPDTDFFLDLSGLETEDAGTIELIAGSISVVARGLAGRELNVRTLGVGAGVRGTTFDVTVAIGGEVLISADEGLVEVTDAAGSTLFAKPGEAVEVTEAEGYSRSIRYNTDESTSFRAQWATERAAAFRANPVRAVRLIAGRYSEARTEFLAAYTALMRRRAVIDRWIEETRRGTERDLDSVSADIEQMQEDLLRVRTIMVNFHHLLVRLDRMFAAARERFAGTGVGQREEFAQAVEVLRLIDEDRDVMLRRLATARHVVKLYTERSRRLISVHSDQ